MRERLVRKKEYYFSDRLKKQLDKIAGYPLTVVEAPSGFGKTTAVREYLRERLPPGACEYWYTCMGEPASVAWRSICALLSHACAQAAGDLASLDMPTIDTLFLMTAHFRNFRCQKETYLVIDNFQLLDCDVPRELLNVFSMHESSNLHIIVITQHLGVRQQLAVYNDNIHTIGATSFFLNREETAALFRMQGIRLGEEELESIYMATEGWISAICLQIINFQETGSFDVAADIEHLVESAIWNRLAPQEKDFLLSVSILDCFTAAQAAMMLGCETLPEAMEGLLKSNDFIRYFPEKHLYGMHGILQDYLRSRFYHSLSRECQDGILRRAGESCAAQGQYCPAARFFLQIGDFDSVLSLPFGCEYLDSQKEQYQPDFFAEIIRVCPWETLRKYPSAMLVFAHWMLMCGRDELFESLRRLLGRALQGGDLAPEELRHLHGEYLFLESLGERGDPLRAQLLQKQAWETLEKPSEIINPQTPWLHLSIFTLGMFWPEPGRLSPLLQQLEQGRAYYDKLTQGHGAGAYGLLQAELLFQRGEDCNAEILCYKALYEASGSRQTDVRLGVELLFARIAIMRGDTQRYLRAVRNIQDCAKDSSRAHTLRLEEQCLSIVGLLLDIKEYLATWFGDMESIRRVLYAPSVPFMQILYLRTLLTEKRYSEFYGVSRLVRKMNGAKGARAQYRIPEIYCLQYLAIADLCTGRGEAAQRHLNQALALALPDRIYLPFAMRTGVLLPLLERAKESMADAEGIDALIALGERYRKGRDAVKKAVFAGKSPLTPREREVALLARERLSAREIAGQLHISETTVRTILKSVYSKLEIHSKNELLFKDF